MYMKRKFINKIGFSLVFLELFVFSCKNPFDESFYGVNQNLPENCSGISSQVIIQPFSEDTENNELSSKVDMSYVGIKLIVDFLEVKIECLIEENEILLGTTAEFDSYWWFMADRLLAETENCRMDFTDFVENVYPIVLFASKNSIMYSGMINVVFADGQLSFTDCARTIQPNFYPAEYTNLNLKITNNENNASSVLTFLNYTELSKKVISLTSASYTFEITGEIKSVMFSGKLEVALDKGKTKLEIVMQPEKLYSEALGSLELKGTIQTQFPINEGMLNLYRQISGKFELIKTLYLGKDFSIERSGIDVENAYDYCFSFLEENLKSGIYWLRLDAGNQEKHKACYYADYAYIVQNQKSVKNIQLTDFYDLFTINYECNGGVLVTDLNDERYSSFDTIILLDENAVFKMGNRFRGWYFDQEFTISCGTIIEAGQLQDDTVLFAKWEPVSDIESVVYQLPENENITVQVNEKTIMTTAKHQNAELFILELENNEKVSVEIKINSIEIVDDLVIITAVVPECERNFYKLGLSGIYKNQLVFAETQIIRL